MKWDVVQEEVGRSLALYMCVLTKTYNGSMFYDSGIHKTVLRGFGSYYVYSSAEYTLHYCMYDLTKMEGLFRKLVKSVLPQKWIKFSSGSHWGLERRAFLSLPGTVDFSVKFYGCNAVTTTHNCIQIIVIDVMCLVVDISSLLGSYRNFKTVSIL